MAAYEAAGETDEWYTPRYIFDAIGETFDLRHPSGPPGNRCALPRGYDCAMNQRDQGSRGPDASYGTQTDAVKTGVGSGWALPLPDP